MKTLRKTGAILILLIIVASAFIRIRWAIDSYSAINALQECNFTANFHLEESSSGFISALQAAGFQDGSGYLKGRVCNGELYAEVYQNKNAGGHAITEVFADQSGCMVNASAILGHAFEEMEEKFGLPFSALKKISGDSKYISLSQLDELFPGTGLCMQMPEIRLTEMVTQFKQCSAPESTYYASDGFHFYEHRESGAVIGAKKTSDENYAVYLLFPGKAQAVIQCSCSDSLKDLEVPESSIPDSVLAVLKFALPKNEK